MADLVGGGLAFAIGELTRIKGPAIEANYSALQVMLGIPAAPLQRDALYAQNLARGVHYPVGQGYFGTTGANVIPDATAFAQAYHSVDWAGNVAPDQLRKDFWGNLRYHGIDPSTQPEWVPILARMGSCLPLDQVIYLYWRGVLTQADLDWYFARQGMPRRRDREGMLRPHYHWDLPTVRRLRGLGAITDAQATQLRGAAGLAQPEDVAWAQALAQVQPVDQILTAYHRRTLGEDEALRQLVGAGVPSPTVAREVLRYSWRLPDMAGAMQLAARRASDDALAALYGLDAGLDAATRALAEADGVPQPTGGESLESEVAGGVDRTLQEWRAGRNLPGFGELLEMQWRLRPGAAGDGGSVIPGVPAWTEADTRNILSMQGHTPVLIDRMMGLARSPINVRIVMAVLHEILTHKQVADDAQVAYGEGTDWVKSVFMDQGLTEPVAKLASDAIQAKADDLLQIERTELEKKTRADRRKTVLDLYRVGSLSADQAAGQLVGEFVPGELATELIAVVDLEVTHAVVTDQIAALERGYQSGKVSRASAVVAMTALLITPVRQQQYLVQWDWRRTEDRTMLGTREVLQLLKDGLITQPLALQRLLNLGWDNGDALVELAAVQHDLAVSGARVAAANARRAESAAAAQQRSESSAARAAVSAESRQAAAEARAEREARSRAGVELVVNPELAHALAASAAATAKHAVAVEKAKGDPVKVAAANAALVVAQDAYTQAVARIHAREVTGEVAPIPQ